MIWAFDRPGSCSRNMTKSAPLASANRAVCVAALSGHR